MKIKVIAVGKLREKHFRKAANVYLERLGRTLKVEEVEVREARKDERRGAAGAVAAEAESLLGAVPPHGVIVAMDERGDAMSSQALADFVQDQMVYGGQDICFLIGGALGLDPSVRRAARKVLRLSQMTLPHELARVVLIEQIYRAMTIIRGEPYHK